MLLWTEQQRVALCKGRNVLPLIIRRRVIHARNARDILRPLVAPEVGLVDLQLLPRVYLHAVVVRGTERKVVCFMVRTYWLLRSVLVASTQVRLVLLSALMHLRAFGVTFSI